MIFNNIKINLKNSTILLTLLAILYCLCLSILLRIDPLEIFNNNSFYNILTLSTVLFFIPQHFVSLIILKNTNLSSKRISRDNSGISSHRYLKYILSFIYVVYFLLFLIVLTPQNIFLQIAIILIISTLEVSCISILTLFILDNRSNIELNLRSTNKSSKPNSNTTFKLFLAVFAIVMICYLGIGFVLETNHKYIFILPLVKLLITFIQYICIDKIIFYSWFYNNYN